MDERRAANGEGDDWLIQIDNPGRSQLPLDQGTMKSRLHQAALKGDWKTAKRILEDHPLLIEAEITGLGETALHVVTLAGNTEFVSNLVNLMDEYQLTYRDQESNTAFFLAASNGAKEIAQVMIAKEPDLPYLRGRGKLLPIHMAACRGQREMVELLYENTNLGLLDDRIYLLVSLIKFDMFAIAMDMINDGGGEGLLLLTDRDGETVLSTVARKFQMLSNSHSSIFSWSTNVQVKEASELLDLICKKLDESQMTTLVGDEWDTAFFAAENGNVEFLRVLIDHFPDLLTRTNKDGHAIFDVAVLHRQKRIFELIDKTETEWGKNYTETLVANGGNHMLQLAAQLAPSNRLACIPGEVLQLQHELLWFKAVQRLVAPQAAQERNLRDNQQTPNYTLLFIQNHQELIKKAEAWVTNMVNPYMFVASLVSGGAYVVPGGTSQNTGYPMFLPDIAYKIFAVAQAISIVSSVASVLTFLSLYMSTYSLENFVREIPIKLLLGLATLFISISSLMVGFVTEIFMYFKQHNLYIKYVVPMALLFCLPPFIFFWHHKGLVFAIIKSTPFTLNHKISTPGANLPQYHTCIDHCV